MFIYNIIQLFRSVKNSKFFSFINISGLSIGMACCILILVWAKNEYEYDKFHVNIDQIYQAYEIQSYANGYKLNTYSTPGPLAHFLKDKFPEIKLAARYTKGNAILKYRENNYQESEIAFADSSILDIFSFEFIQGNPKTCLNNLGSIVLTDKMAEKYFGKEDPIGKSIRVNNKTDLIVTAVVKTYPNNSSFNFKFLVPFELVAQMNANIKHWGWNSFSTVVLVNKEVSIKNLETKIKNVLKDNNKGSVADLYLYPFNKLHLYGIDDFQLVLFFRIMLIIGLFIIIIACINFMNLATARSANRAKEVGIRKVVGASRFTLILKFYGESLLFAFISLAFAILLADLFLPAYNQLLRDQLTLSIFSPVFFSGLIGITFLVGIISGSYPAIYLSRFNPINVLKGNLKSGAKSAFFRKVMVIFQFSLSIILTVCTIFLFKQFIYINSRDTGLDRHNIIQLSTNNSELKKKYSILKNELLKIPEIINVSGGNNSPIRIGNSTSGFSWPGKDTTQEILFSNTAVDLNYFETFKMKIVEGRSFSKEYPSDTLNVIINEKAAGIIGKKLIAGEKAKIWGKQVTIIGVVKDFNFGHFAHPIGPLFLEYKKNGTGQMFIRLKNDKDFVTIKKIEDTWKKINPDFPFTYEFVQDSFEEIFRTEKKVSDLVRYFTFLAIFISCLGLLALAAFIAEQRSKSMVIRKVHGASILQIVVLMSSEFIKWVLIASIIAFPIAYIFLHKVFQTYYYHTEMTVWVFIGAGLGTLVIAMITVFYQALKTARQNPAEILKYE